MRTILVIEDNEDIRENVAEILTLSGYKVVTAANGSNGVAAAQQNKPDLIICDIMMPGMDGYGVLHEMHRDAGTQHIPFIFLTSRSERSDFRAAMEMGADDYITKPFSGEELLNAIESRLRKQDIIKKEVSAGLQGLNELRIASASGRTLEDLSAERNTNTYTKRQEIYRQAGHPRYLFYILKGKVKTFKTHEDGKDLVIDLYDQGDFFGYTALIENAAYTSTAVATEDTELALIPRKDFEALLNTGPAIARKLISLLSRNVLAKEDHLVGIAYDTLRKKVAGALISMQQKYHTNKNEPYTMSISREELAAIAGTATESLIRTLSDLKSEKLIDIRTGKITITDEQKLRDLIR